MPDVNQERESRRHAGAHLIAGGMMVGGAAAAQDAIARKTGLKSTMAVARDIKTKRAVRGKHLAHLGGWVGTRGTMAAGIPLAAIGAKNLVSPKPKKVDRLSVKEDVVQPTVERTAGGALDLDHSRPVPKKARLAELATVTAGSTAGGIGGAALARRAIKGGGARRLAAVGLGTAAGAATGSLASAPFGRRAVNRATRGQYTYSTEEGVHRQVKKADAPVIMPKKEQQAQQHRKHKAANYALASAGLGVTALGLRAPAAVGWAAKRSKRLGGMKPVKRIVEAEKKTTPMSWNVGVLGGGVGSAGALNAYRIQSTENRAAEAKVKKSGRRYPAYSYEEGGPFHGRRLDPNEQVNYKDRDNLTRRMRRRELPRPMRSSRMEELGSFSRRSIEAVKRAEAEEKFEGVDVQRHQVKKMHLSGKRDLSVDVAKAMKMPDGSYVRFRAIKRGASHARDVDTIEAMHRGKNVGYMHTLNRDLSADTLANRKSMIDHIKVRDDYQRKGIATGMWNRAKSAGWEPKHSPVLSTEGRAWSARVGKAAAWDEAAHQRDIDGRFKSGGRRSARSIRHEQYARTDPALAMSMSDQEKRRTLASIKGPNLRLHSDPAANKEMNAGMAWALGQAKKHGWGTDRTYNEFATIVDNRVMNEHARGWYEDEGEEFNPDMPWTETVGDAEGSEEAMRHIATKLDDFSGYFPEHRPKGWVPKSERVKKSWWDHNEGLHHTDEWADQERHKKNMETWKRQEQRVEEIQQIRIKQGKRARRRARARGQYVWGDPVAKGIIPTSMFRPRPKIGFSGIRTGGIRRTPTGRLVTYRGSMG